MRKDTVIYFILLVLLFFGFTFAIGSRIIENQDRAYRLERTNLLFKVCPKGGTYKNDDIICGE